MNLTPFFPFFDVCSRRIVGWAMASQQTRDLAEHALDMALVQRQPGHDLVLHHDRGSQYTSARYRAKVEATSIVLSMSRPGTPSTTDNAMAENFFSTLKLELVPEAFASREVARLAVFNYIETFYNRTRMHSALDCALGPLSEESGPLQPDPVFSRRASG
ncbi:DDE-type integrase/transposase/recombinase [Luteimonas sp. SJ-92]|uniref:DDE-type integrase/transposase/recombinase n=1 Tax=Luteimonas salinisoli TaxID=2752307 RepID=A0A853JAQ7_9GAMM|nr:DDE-type integrase/transposase/recombinase [Luteimonas salinisoli]NZA25852.1 DDE-type integrase/transposase/recombinase [Luteimonas salinisoli]